ncbi:MAG: SpoIID/LytB domain-containing protein [Clostridia bacterium]|nr:SpoIID/LytB domain-containing protein [Clostridia bacterium]
MIRYVKIALALVLVVIIMLSGMGLYAATITIPEKVRVGLFYEGTALSSFIVSAEGGLQIGYYKDNNFNVIYDQQVNEELAIRKDSYYLNNSGKLTEYNPASSTTSAGEKIGPFHIQAGGVYPDYISASQQVEILKQAGITAYPVFIDAWQVWTGFYPDQISAQTGIAAVETVTGTGTCSVVQPDNYRVVIESKSGNVLMVFANSVNKLQLHPKAGTSGEIFRVNGLRYRGDLEIRRLSGSDMTLINIVPFEQYVYGVVPEEIESYSPSEALKAQAVVARTYALTRIGGHSKWNFDLCPKTHCQMYGDQSEGKGGYDAEKAAANKAVDETKGKIVKYNGRPATTVFFASSGGWTEDVENVWGTEYPYLKSVEDKYEPDTSSHYYWTKTITAAKIAETTKKSKSRDVGDVTGISINKLTAAKRILELEVKGTKDNYTYPRETFRTAFGLSSNMYTMTSDADVTVKALNNTKRTIQAGNRKVMTANGVKATAVKGNILIIGKDGVKKTVQAVPVNYTFTGKGWGHGVGMSQEGAKGMAKAGFTYEQILKYYYKDVTVE